MIMPFRDKHKWYNQIVSGGDVDVDRMDYIVRDSKATGVTVTLNDKGVFKIDRSSLHRTNYQTIGLPIVS